MTHCTTQYSGVCTSACHRPSVDKNTRSSANAEGPRERAVRAGFVSVMLYLRFSRTPTCDIQTDRQTDKRTDTGRRHTLRSHSSRGKKPRSNSVAHRITDNFSYNLIRHGATSTSTDPECNERLSCSACNSISSYLTHIS